MAFFTSLFRNLKDGGAVYKKPSLAHQMLIDNPGGLFLKDGGAVKKLFNLTPEMVNTMYSKPLATKMMVKPTPKKKGGKVKKKEPAKKKSRQKK